MIKLLNCQYISVFLYIAYILSYAQSRSIIPINKEPYSTSNNFKENSQTRYFSIIIISIIAILFDKSDEYSYFIYYALFYDTIYILGLAGLPRTTILWLFEFINRYLFGFSGCATYLNCFIQFLRGIISTSICSLILYYKNNIFTRSTCVLLSFFICQIEFKKPICLAVLYNSFESFFIFMIFNSIPEVYNIISIIILIYYIIVEFIIPHLTSISLYLFIYKQLLPINIFMKIIKLGILSLTGPILIGSLLDDNYNYFLTELIIIHSMNRYISEPHVFGLAIFIARFTLYYDLNMTSNLALNFLIGLLVSKKFFSILPLLIFRLKIKIYITNFLEFLKHFPDYAQVICIYARMFIIDPFNIYCFPVFLWSLITGSPMKFINFFKKSSSPILNYIFPFPTPPRGNIFWDFPKEIINVKKSKIELCVYFSYLNSIKKNLYYLIKTGQFSIVDEDSFFLFNKDEYAILVHILSINSFSIKFQIRCLQFIKGYINYELSHVKSNKTHKYLQSNYSPVSQKVKLAGFNHNFINLPDYGLLCNIGRDIGRSWMSYAIISLFLKNRDKFFLSELFDFPFPDENDDKYNKLDENVFSQFENKFADSSRRVLVFLNLIYREIKRNSDRFECFFTRYYKFTNKFPLFKNFNDLDNDIEYDDDISNNEFSLIDIEQAPEQIENEEEDCDQNFIKNVKWLIKESAKRICLYWICVLNFSAPSLEDNSEVIEFINNIENLYLFVDNDDDTWENLSMNIKGHNNTNNNNEIDRTYNIESLKYKRIFTVIRINRQIKAVELVYDTQNWSVYKLNKESVKSIWASECFNVLFLNREPLIVEDKCIRDIIIQTSDLPNKNPSYVSGIEESNISELFFSINN